MRKRAVVDPDQIVVCVASHWASGSEFHAQGERARRGRIGNYSAPYWAIDGSTDDDLHRLRQELQGDAVALPEPARAPVPKVRATRSFTTTLNTVAGGAAAPSVAMFAIAEGDVFAEGDPIPKRFPDAFEKVKV